MKVKITIKSFWGSVLFEAEKEDYTLKNALQGAVLQGAVLQDADLQGADLRGAVLQGADLQGAVLQGAVLQDADLRGAVLQGADLRGADLRGADLRGAVLQGADLRGADLRGAKNIPQSWINECSRDILYVMSHLKKEVPFLREKLVKGEVNGQDYFGNCACLLGTLANADGGLDKVCTSLPFYDKGTHNPGENFFLNIRPGDTPEKSWFAKHAVDLCDLVLNEGKKKVVKKITKKEK